MKKNQGVTLIEIIIVMAIIGILTMIAGPPLGIFLANQKLITFSSDVAHSISLARNQARTTGAQVQMTWTNDPGNTNQITGWIYDFSQAAVTAAATADTNFRITADPQRNFLGQGRGGYFIWQCSGGTAEPTTTSLLFNVNGTIQMVDSSGTFLNGPASIKFSSTGTPTVRTLTFAPSGNVNLAVTSNPNYKSAQPTCP